MSDKRFTTPVGRIVMGSLYEPQTTDMDGKPLVFKNGEPYSKYFCALAIPKKGEKHWAETPWGAIIWAQGHVTFPSAAPHASFAWKIKDGDDTTPNEKGKRLCDRVGYAGHWVLSFTNNFFHPPIYKAEGTVYKQVLEANFVNPGDFVQIVGDVEGNKASGKQKPGVFLNHVMTGFVAYGERIESFEPVDPNSVGFGNVALPAGASLTPLASTVPMPAPTTQAPTPAAVTPPIPIVPYTAILTPPAPPVIKPARVMLEKAAAVPYESYIAAGWTDAQLIQEGLMAP